MCEIKRVRLVNREPVSLEVTYLPQALGERLEKADLVTRDIFLILENDCGIPSAMPTWPSTRCSPMPT